MSKYDPLWDHIVELDQDQMTMTFDEGGAQVRGTGFRAGSIQAARQ